MAPWVVHMEHLIHVQCVRKANHHLVDDSILRDRLRQRQQFEIRWDIRDKLIGVETSRLYQRHANMFILAEECREHASGRPRADYDVIKFFSHVVRFFQISYNTTLICLGGLKTTPCSQDFPSIVRLATIY